MSAEITQTSLFEETRPPIEGRRQSAVATAEANYRTARAAQLALWERERDAARDRLEAAKLLTADLPEASPEDPKAAAAWQAAREEYEAANRAMIAVEQQPDDRPLRDQLGRDIDAADQQFKSDLAALRASLDITAS